MKTYYLKSILMFALGGILTSAAGNLSSGGNSSGISSDNGNSSRVNASDVKVNIESFQIWQRMLPQTFSLSSEGNLTFSSVALSEEDADLIKLAIQEYNFHNRRILGNFQNVPFCSELSLAHSYFIPLKDIDSIRKHYGTCNIQGIRAHMGLTNVGFHSPDSVSTHLYLAPALNDTTDIDVSHYYDLTMPCPNTCPKRKISMVECGPHPPKKPCHSGHQTQDKKRKDIRKP